MTAGDRDFDELLRSALHSVADPIEPTGDGLTRIRERIDKPWLWRRVSLLVTEFVDLAWLVFIRCEPALGWARTKLTTASAALAVSLRRWSAPMLEWAAPVADRMRPRLRQLASHGSAITGWAAQPSGHGAARLNQRKALLNSLVAAAAVTTLVIGVAYALGINPVRTTITSIGQITGGVGGGAGGSGSADSAGSSRVPAGRGHGPSGHHSGDHSGGHRRDSPGPQQTTCPPSPSPQDSNTPSPSPTDTGTPSPTPSPTTSPTPSPTTSPTPSPTTSPQGSAAPFSPSNGALACPSPGSAASPSDAAGQTGATGDTGDSDTP
jgi:hypothetical protein